jgi:catechol-2,3-dioxygenase
VRVHHLAFRTHDLVRLERFYTDVLGLEVARRDGERSVWLRAGGTILMLEIAEDGEACVAAGTKELVAFAVGEADMPRWRRTLAGASVAVEGETAFSVYFRDPDGRRVALSHY